jgi:hypothetical protein
MRLIVAFQNGAQELEIGMAEVVSGTTFRCALAGSWVITDRFWTRSGVSGIVEFAVQFD